MLSALPHNLVSRIGHCLCSERGFVGPAILKLRGLEKKYINKNFFFFVLRPRIVIMTSLFLLSLDLKRENLPGQVTDFDSLSVIDLNLYIIFFYINFNIIYYGIMLNRNTLKILINNPVKKKILYPNIITCK